jgi:hypothetical protein
MAAAQRQPRQLQQGLEAGRVAPQDVEVDAFGALIVRRAGQALRLFEQRRDRFRSGLQQLRLPTEDDSLRLALSRHG